MTDVEQQNPFSPTAWPALRAFCRGYLHEDAAVTHGSLARAFRAFWSDAADGERRQFLAEWRRLVPADTTAAEGALVVKALLEELGASWVPPRQRGVDALRRLVDRQHVP